MEVQFFKTTYQLRKLFEKNDIPQEVWIRYYRKDSGAEFLFREVVFPSFINRCEQRYQKQAGNSTISWIIGMQTIKSF